MMKRNGEGRGRAGEGPRGRLLAAVIGSLLLGTAGAQLGEMKHTERISLSSSGTPGNLDSTSPSISEDGRYVAFASDADNLVPGDTNGASDVFVRDRVTGTTERVSLSSRESGAQSNGSSHNPVISADGRYVVFGSKADNLVDEDTNRTELVFVRDRVMARTELVSLKSTGALASYTGERGGIAISRDGRYVAFISNDNDVVPDDHNNSDDIFVRDRAAGTTELISRAASGAPSNQGSCHPAISADGRFVAFCSQATNLVPGDRNEADDVFVRDRVANTTELVSVTAAGTTGNHASEMPAISSDGRYVAFLSDATNLVSGDTNDRPDVFVRDRQERKTIRISFTPTAQDDPDERLWGQASISGDGHLVAFVSYSLAPGGTQPRWQIVVRDWMASKTEPISVSDTGTPGNDTSVGPAMSTDGRCVAFESAADNLVPGDTNGHRDIFVRELSPRPAGLVADPAALTFGPIAVGRTTSGTLMLRNDSPQLVTGTVGALALPFMVAEGGGSFTLEPGASRRVTVSFTPTRPSDLGGFQAQLTITSDDPSSPTLAVLVSGESFSPADGRLTLIPSPQQGLTLELTARDLVYGECKEASLMLQNRGTGPLTGRVESLQAPFAVVEGEGEFSLEPGASKRVTVRFCAPAGGLPGRYMTRLRIASSDPAAPNVEVPVRAEPP